MEFRQAQRSLPLTAERVVDRKRMRKTIKPPKSDDEPKAPSELTATLERTLEELHAGNCRRRSAR